MGGQRRRAPPQHAALQLRQRAATEGHPQAGQLVEHAAERPHVGLGAVRLPPPSLGAHVVRRADRGVHLARAARSLSAAPGGPAGPAFRLRRENWRGAPTADTVGDRVRNGPRSMRGTSVVASTVESLKKHELIIATVS